MYHYIYRIEFLKGEIGRYYIGKRTTKSNPYKDNCYRGSGRFCKSFFDKYGTEGTYRKVIIECNPSKKINADREAFWIGDLWKTDPLCMNQAPGGINGGAHNGQNRSGKNNTFYGRKHTEESKNKMSISKKGSTWHKEYGIECISLDGNLIKIYKTRKELKDDGFNPKCVDNVIAGRSKTHKNYRFNLKK